MLNSCGNGAAQKSEETEVAEGPPGSLGRVSSAVTQGIDHPASHPDPACGSR